MERTLYSSGRITVKLKDRLIKETKKYKNVLTRSRQSGVNRFNTAAIIWNMSHDVFGYDKFSEVTIDILNETTCILSIKKNTDFLYLIDVYPITYDLGAVNSIQISDYQPYEGMENVVVTDGISWNVYKIDLNMQPCLTDQFNFLELDPKDPQDIEVLYKICRDR